MAIITRDQPRKGFYPYAARNSSLAVGVSNTLASGFLGSDYFTNALIPARTGFVFVVDRIQIRAIHPVSEVGTDNSVVTVRITDGSTTSLLPFKVFRQDISGADYYPTVVDWKVNGKLVLKEGFNLNAKISDESGTLLFFDGPASISVTGEYVQVEEARQRDLLGDVYVGSIHGQANGANVTVAPRIAGKHFVVEGFYIMGLGATNDATQNLTLRFSSADDGSGTNENFMRYSSRRGEHGGSINHGTSDCFIAGPAGYGVTALQTTSKKFSAIVVGRYVKDTGQYASVNSALKRFGDRFWFHATFTGSNTATFGQATKPGYVVVEGYQISGTRVAAGVSSTVSIGYGTTPITTTIYAGPEWDAQALVDGLGLPALNSAEPKALVGAGAAWQQGNVTVWGRHVSDKTATYRAISS